jgi:hypothetical protein
MSRLILTGVALLFSCLPLLAQEDGKPDSAKAGRRSTFVSIRALANTAGPAMTEPDRQDVRSTVKSVRDLTDTTKNADEEPADAPKPREPKPKARKDVRERPPVENAKKPAVEQAKKQVQRQPQNDLARQQGGLGFQPWGGDPWMGGWGNGYYSNRITGYRSFRYGGYGNGYGWPYYSGYGYGYGGYGFGYGFSPVMPSISGPVTTRYADPVGRQHKMMDDSIRKFAEGK